MSWWSNQDLSQVSARIGAEIDAFYAKNATTISSIILCGYSLGAMLVRRAFLDASGLGYPAGQRRQWASAVERIVLVGAICRGFHFRRLPFSHRVALWLAARVGRAKALRSAFVGEPWASNVRLDWITYWRDHETRPRVINIRGTEDSLVYDEDAVDVEKDPQAVYVRVTGANHDSVIKPTDQNGALFLEAFAGDPATRVAPSIKPKERVYFLLHGMRSSKYFMLALAERLRAEGDSVENGTD
jgi:pimeloyl-ACP methyl ester carboxylesterase